MDYRRTIEQAQARRIPVEPKMLASAVAALAAGKSLLLVGEDAARGDSVAEVLADTAMDSGASLATLVTRGSMLALVTPSEIIRDQFVDDVWLVVRSATLESLERLPRRSEQRTSFLAVATDSHASTAELWRAAGGRNVALVSLE